MTGNVSANIPAKQIHVGSIHRHTHLGTHLDMDE